MTTPPNDQKCIMIIAGEASGDAHGAGLVNAMRRLDGRLFFCGIGGERLRAAGVKIVVEASDLSVVGLTEVFAKLPQLMQGISTAKGVLKSLRPDLLILIDFPDFNLHIAGAAKKLGIPVMYYISPQIWAWRQGRVKKIRQRVDRMVVILPFEAAFYQKHGVPVSFVGHPLMDDLSMVEENAGQSQGDPSKPVIGLLPGSRDREVQRHLPVMLEAATLLQRLEPGLQFMISAAPSVGRDLINPMVAAAVPQCTVYEGNVRHIFRNSTLVVAASGTVTLEAALQAVPTIIMYRISATSTRLGRWLIQVQHAGLINLIVGKTLLPELIQEEATPENIAAHVLSLVRNPDRMDRMRRELLDARALLGEPGASDRAAGIAMELLETQRLIP